MSSVDPISGANEMSPTGAAEPGNNSEMANRLKTVMKALEALENSIGSGCQQGSGTGNSGSQGQGAGNTPPPAQNVAPGPGSPTDAPPGTPGGEAEGAPTGGDTPAEGGAPAADAAPTPAGPTPSGEIPGISNNAGGVPQASAISGVNPNAVEVLQTGTGDDKTFNMTNNTQQEQSFTYSTQGQNKGTLTLQPGQTGAFVAGSSDLGVRISPSDASGNTPPNVVLYEDGGAANGQAPGAGNPDVSKVDGDKDVNGNSMNMTITLSNGRTAGDGNAIRAYGYPTDDAAAMGLAGDPSKTVNVVMSNA